ncbi:MAG: class A beta-lactamase [Sphingomonadales bacterium]|nr:class A beta-lactamase [Sphingomonadales bacterium]
MDRRQFAIGAAALLMPGCAQAASKKTDGAKRLAAIEKAAGGRLGAFLLDTGSGESFGWRADERFCHCSTFKFSLAAMALREADAGRLNLQEALSFSRADIVGYSPVIEANLDKGRLPILALAEAAQVTSDNAAANVLMRRLGGPAAMTRFWRELGDKVSRLDGYEPAINVIPPGTEENSTTPRAMAETLRRIALGDVLAGESRARLRGWMEETRSGMRRIRAAIPPDWRGLDKTGTGMRAATGNKTNDIAVFLPPSRAPLVVTAYYENPAFAENTRPEDEAVLKSLGELAVAWAS